MTTYSPAMRRYLDLRAELDRHLLDHARDQFCTINQLVGDCVSAAIYATATDAARESLRPACDNCGGDPVRAGIGGNCIVCGRTA